LETGVQWRSGNRDYADLFARLNLWRITEPYSYLSTFMLERADTDEFPRWLRAETLWELDPAGAVHPMAALEVERDTDAALALRGSLSLGVAKTLFESDADRLSANAGIGGTVERYDAGLFDNASVLSPERGEESARTDLHARLQLRYAHALFGNGEFSSALGLYPTLSGFDDFRARSESALLFPFTPRLKMKFNVLVDYESAPELSGFDHWRTSVGASLLWDF
jgi:hypothetical protein